MIFLFNKECYRDNLNVKFTKKDNLNILPKAKEKALIKSVQKESKFMCNVECGLECTCFLSILNGKMCELFDQTAKDYLVKDTNQEISMHVKNMHLETFVNSGFSSKTGKTIFNKVLLIQ